MYAAALSESRGTGGLTLDVGRLEGSGAWLEIKRRSPLGLQEPENWKFERRVAMTRERSTLCMLQTVFRESRRTSTWKRSFEKNICCVLIEK